MLAILCACNGYYYNFIKTLITCSAVHDMLLSNTTLFHPVHAAGTYGYITLVISQRKTHIHVKKKECENYILGKICASLGFLA